MHEAIHDGGAVGVNNQEYPAALLGCKSKNFSDCLVGCQINEGDNPLQDPLKSKISFWSSSLIELVIKYFYSSLFYFWWKLGLPSYKAIGVQTEKALDPVDLIIGSDPSTNCQLTRKLLCIWNPISDGLTGRNLVSKLFVACETDFHVLFGFLSFNSSKTTVNSLGNYSDVPMPQATQPPHSAEAATVSSLYSVLTKVFMKGVVNLLLSSYGTSSYNPIGFSCSFLIVFLFAEVHNSCYTSCPWCR